MRTLQEEVLFINSKATVLEQWMRRAMDAMGRERESQRYSRESLRLRNRESKSSIVSEWCEREVGKGI